MRLFEVELMSGPILVKHVARSLAGPRDCSTISIAAAVFVLGPQP
jgi:hypothetical protein